MSGHGDMTLPSTRRPRKSTGHSPVRKRMEKENITVDLASSLAGNAGRKKSRSKSMGPGGLDILKSGSGNRRQSLAAPPKPPPRSILKPTMPLLPEIPPHKSKVSKKSPPSGTIQGTDKLANPFQNEDSSSSGTRIALRTEEEQQAAAREREERERAELEKEINDRREARRKSLANRRVSFAAEATMHTFQVIEYMQDSTTSTDDTRRASSLAGATPKRTEDNDPPSTPPDQVEEVLPESSEDQRDLHQKKRRRSSALENDLTLASSVYSSDSEGITEVHEEIVSDSDSDSDADGVTMDLDGDDMTGTSVASAMTARSGFTDDSNDTLDDALRMASRQAETQNLDDEEEVIPSFGWVKKPAPKLTVAADDQENQPNDDFQDHDDTAAIDMEITKAMGGIITPDDDDDHNELEEGDMSMDVTSALGRVIPQQNQNDDDPEVDDDGSADMDATMELTKVVGGIRGVSQTDDDDDENEDMSMEFTSVMGGFIAGNKINGAKRTAPPGRRGTIIGDTTMDMTVGLGRIISHSNNDEEEEDMTVGMDMTTAVGGIIGGQSPARDQAQAKHAMEQEADRPDGGMELRTSAKRRLSDALSTRNTPDVASPSFLPYRGKGLRRSIDHRSPETSTRKSPVQNAVSQRSPSPKKLASPATPQHSSPVKTPASQRSQRRSISPRRPLLGPTNTTPKSRPTPQQNLKSSLFQLHPATGATTPQVVLTPQKRQLTGLGADRSGLGSPKVAAILERRASIGDSADLFVPQNGPKTVAFVDPQSMADEIDKERQEERDREDRRSILEREADGDEENNTATLKDMISSMTPKKNKNPLKGRKSLAVGSGRGLLGKRPAELDDDEEDDYDRDGVKRLKNHQSSPVKNVRLHAPPSKEETTGRLTRSGSNTLELGNSKTITPSLTLSPAKERNAVSSPRSKGRFRDVQEDQPTNTFNFDKTVPLSNPEIAVDDDGDRIHLQDFLNMTSIRFMELTTTKRRHTEAPTTSKGFVPSKEDVSLERCVVAGACTVPMLELYQHSCRELKKYISEGRRIVREIETETFEENPPLFKEYISATPEFKTLMDNQFKNVKTHARLLSKAMWYEWRMKLQDGLKEGLINISEGMIADESLFHEQQKLLDAVFPQLVQHCERLATEKDNLEAMAEELAACDPQDLQSARAELANANADIKAKQRQIEELQKQLEETESGIANAKQQKQSYVADIEEAEKVREECRGWSSTEINALKGKVDQLEKKYGWAIVGCSGTHVSMTYQREVQLDFDISLFADQGRGSDSQINVQYIGVSREQGPEVPLPEKEFFVQCIRDHVRRLSGPSFSMHRPTVHQMLDMVSAAWKKANHVAGAVRLLNCTFPTTVRRTSDSSIAVRSTLLLVPIETKVEVVFELKQQDSAAGVQVSITPQVRVIYGEHFKVEKMAEFLATRIGTTVLTREEKPDSESWNKVVMELHGRLLARGRK
ncbi:Spc7-domain-containing protein [Xylariaceae sp. FL0255]|nr:Spc7-domain-containing protein [Xylariaceae sp. FL0255]